MREPLTVGRYVTTPYGPARVIGLLREHEWDFGRPRQRLWVRVELLNGQKKSLPVAADVRATLV